MRVPDEECYIIEINVDNKPKTLSDKIRSLPQPSIKKSTTEEKPVTLYNRKKKEKKPKEKKSKKGLSDVFYGVLDEEAIEEGRDPFDNIDAFIEKSEKEVTGDTIIKKQKGNYKKLKKESNYKKEFAEELTLLYTLLEETGKFGKELEGDLKTIKGSRVRGVSKYSNDLAELILSSKQNKLNILKEIAGIKKTIADLQLKSESKNKDNKDGKTNVEHLAAAYFKNAMGQGRASLMQHYSDDNDDYGNIIDQIERVKKVGYEPDDTDDDKYLAIMEERLDNTGNPFRTSNGSKYIEYENLGVKLVVKKCVDTGEWRLIGVDKYGQEVPDYPVPSRRELGRMKFSADGNYATDEYGRMYGVLEYFLPEDEYDDDDDE